MNIDGAFPSNYLKAADLPGPVTIVIADCVIKDLDGDKKPVLYFVGKDKGLVLNKTNSNRLKELYGVETDDWRSKTIEVYPSETEFGGKTVPCLRVRAPTKKADAAAEPAKGEGADDPGFEEPPF